MQTVPELTAVWAVLQKRHKGTIIF